MYKKIIRPILFRFNPETAHNLTLALFSIIKHIPFFHSIIRLLFAPKTPSLEREVFGVKFPNPVGLSGGLDKNAEHYNELADLGFGFVEVGSLTPQPQDGNPKPRLFRVPQDRAIINRMGINNKGVRHALDELRRNRPKCIVAANISKNASTLNDDASKDFESSFALLYDFVDMFVLNISCPNVTSVDELQDVGYLSEIVDKLLSLRLCYGEYKPIILKVSPDIPRQNLDEILDYMMSSGVDGIIASNTTRSRNGLTLSNEEIDKIGNGGLSGAPLYQRMLETVRYINRKTEGRLPIIASGGIMSPEQAKEVLDAGASLIEVYTGFIYEGPSFVKKILKYLENQ